MVKLLSWGEEFRSEAAVADLFLVPDQLPVGSTTAPQLLVCTDLYDQTHTDQSISRDVHETF